MMEGLGTCSPRVPARKAYRLLYITLLTAMQYTDIVSEHKNAQSYLVEVAKSVLSVQAPSSPSQPPPFPPSSRTQLPKHPPFRTA